MRVRHVSSLLFLQKLPVTHQWRKWSLRTRAATAFGYAFPKTIGRFRMLFIPNFQLAPTRVRRFIHSP